MLRSAAATSAGAFVYGSAWLASSAMPSLAGPKRGAYVERQRLATAAYASRTLCVHWYGSVDESPASHWVRSLQRPGASRPVANPPQQNECGSLKMIQ